ncbi:hypothetical protein BsWGS_23659 [Bradybaena similaris]
MDREHIRTKPVTSTQQGNVEKNCERFIMSAPQRLPAKLRDQASKQYCGHVKELGLEITVIEIDVPGASGRDSHTRRWTPDGKDILGMIMHESLGLVKDCESNKGAAAF